MQGENYVKIVAMFYVLSALIPAETVENNPEHIL